MDGPVDVDALAEALRTDGVVIDRVLGSGETVESEDRLSALIRETPFPVYVALVAKPTDLPEDPNTDSAEILARLLSRRLGEGLYVVATPDSSTDVLAYGLGTDRSAIFSISLANDVLLSRRADEAAGPDDFLHVQPVVAAEGQVRAAESMVDRARTGSGHSDVPALTEADARELVDRAVELEASERFLGYLPTYHHVTRAASGLSSFVGSLSGLVIALLVGRTLAGWPRKGTPGPTSTAKEKARAAKRPEPTPPDLATERAAASTLAEQLSERLAAADWESMGDQDVAARALTAQSVLDGLLESDDVADAVGARVVARTGLHDLTRGERGQGSPLRLCFFDPRHGGVATTAGWRLGDGTVDVPCCARCGAAVDKDATPDYLVVQAGSSVRPYWERDDVWARTGFGSLVDDIAADVVAERGER